MQFIFWTWRKRQALLSQSESTNRLHYWLRDGKSTNTKVDYGIQSGTQIIPNEVKSGSAGALRSLYQFVAERSLKHAIRFDLNTPVCTGTPRPICPIWRQHNVGFLHAS